MSVNGSSERPRRREGKGREGQGSGPAEMTEAEKRAAEWEARHDVAARGRRVPPDVLQHYLAHERLVEGAPSGPTPARFPGSAGRTGAGRTEESERAVTPPTETPVDVPPPRRRLWRIPRIFRGERR